jgi:hypothetical protein
VEPQGRERWLQYSPRTANCVPLDPTAYSSTIYDGEVIPWPSWCCKAPDGGVHVDARLAAIDVHLSRAPSGAEEITWNCDFQVLLATTQWLAQIDDLIDGARVALGQVSVDGQPVPEWATIREARAPGLFSSEGRSKVCPICGDVYDTLRGKVYFADPDVAERPLIIASNAIFVREDEAIRRGLRTPVGAFKPVRVGLRPGGHAVR